MGSMSLVCPMCCGETFDNSQSLKYHLLSMTDNLYCPNCAERSDSVAALIQHLDSCGENSELVGVYPLGDYKSITIEAEADHTHHDYFAAESEEAEVITAEIQVAETNVVHENLEKSEEEKGAECVELSEKSIKEENMSVGKVEAKRELYASTDNNADPSNSLEMESCTDRTEEGADGTEFVQVKEETSEVESDALYSCSSCGISFNSVLSHIKQYHDGQEVVLEMAEQQMNDLPKEIDERENDRDNDAEEEIDDTSTNYARSVKRSSSMSSSGAAERSSSEVPRARQTMNTLRSEECVDSEGRLYTRKVVQIERFWDQGAETPTDGQSRIEREQQKQSSKSASMIEKFFSNAQGLKIRTKNSKITETEAATTTTATVTTTMTTTTTTTPATSTNSTTVPHATVRMYRCNKCLEQFSKLADFRLHTCIHGNNQCDLCEQAFASAKALQLHSRIHEAEAENTTDTTFVCQTCGTEFSSHKSLRLHSRMHAPVRARHVDAPEGTATENFTCLECGKTLSESYRKAHMALHKGDSVTCTVCNRKFDSADSLAMHAAVHMEFGQQKIRKNVQWSPLEDNANADIEPNGVGGKRAKKDKESNKSGAGGDASEKPYQCQHCGRRFTRPHEKVKHERIHTGEKPHACEVCGKTFRVSYCLTLHMRTHTGVRPYACQHCGKRFKASSVYNHHLLTHGEERAYTCPYCPKTFKTRVQLAGHKNSHTKPFRCTECSRPFASLYAARAHIQTHKKDNNLKFSCYICGASYGRAFALKDHLKQHTGQDILIPPPEPAREEEVADADDFIIAAQTADYEEIEEIEEIDEEEHKLVKIAAEADNVDVDCSTFDETRDRLE